MTMRVKQDNGKYEWEAVCGCSECKEKFEAAFECSRIYDFSTSNMEVVGQNGNEITVKVYYNLTT